MIEFGSQTPSPRRSRILVADDTDSIRALYRKLLATDGHEVIDVGDGEAALAAVQKHHPDVVLLDVTMPHLDGLEVCRRLKADPATASIPVVFLTAKSQEAEIQRGLSLGAAGYVTKPFDALTLGQHVKDIVDKATS